MLQLLQALLPDGVEDPVIVGGGVSSGRLSLRLPVATKTTRWVLASRPPRVTATNSLVGLIGAGLVSRLLRFPPLVPVDQLRQIGGLFGVPYNQLVL